MDGATGFRATINSFTTKVTIPVPEMVTEWLNLTEPMASPAPTATGPDYAKRWSRVGPSTRY